MLNLGRSAASLLVCAMLLGWATLFAGLPDDPYPIVSPPSDWGLDPFYTKCVLVHGFPVVGSDRVSDYALKEAAWIVEHMLEPRPDVRDRLIKNRVRCVVMAWNERTTDVPEHSDLTPALFWNRRARGLGATRRRPAVSCGEENLLGYPGDPYRTENILVHEFAHTIHTMALVEIEPDFQRRLREIYEHAMKAGLWQGTYAATNPGEYWAEGVQSYFDTNRSNDSQHNHVDTREELADYDPDLYALIDEAFRQTPWRYVVPWERPESERRHLLGFDRSKAPRFSWNREEVEEGQRILGRRQEQQSASGQDGQK